ncbi:MAG: Gfo/Idh/MocA family oxidoreductase [Thermoguttaceae bacterium]|nr:Gfo/Idh/MocA family oxidoreductase [Thermoguttaceae bacterium]MDW8036779.1 Gfo/Idh/MocA family oxidoreductase [Thermoguttaceae bacterium]
MRRRISRRTVLKTASLAAAGALLNPGRVWPRGQSPNERLRCIGIGVGGRGADNVNECASAGAEFIALCDVDEKRAAPTYQRFPHAKIYKDFRKALEELEPKYDAVVISTPDHTHAPAAAMALRMKKHVYCEKPLTHNVYEARLLTELAEKNNLVTQIGTQIHAGDNYRRVVEWIQAGLIGPVEEVHVWHPARYSPGDRPKDTPPCPPWLDWDLWLGPAPYRPYHPAYVPGNWRGWWDFANGGIGDFFCHYVDLAFWALDLKYPTHVAAEGHQPVHPESCAQWLIVRYQFPARGKLPPVRLTWYDGGKQPPWEELDRRLADMTGIQEQIPRQGAGVLFVGKTGMVLADYSTRHLLPKKKFAEVKLPEPTIPASIGHHREWVEACKKGGKTTCHFGYSGPLTEAALLGTVSYRVGSPLEWDGPAMKATNCPEAERFLRREYRKGWTL